MTDIYMYWVNGLILLGISLFKSLAAIGAASYLPAFARVSHDVAIAANVTEFNILYRGTEQFIRKHWTNYFSIKPLSVRISFDIGSARFFCNNNHNCSCDELVLTSHHW